MIFHDFFGFLVDFRLLGAWEGYLKHVLSEGGSKIAPFGHLRNSSVNLLERRRKMGEVGAKLAASMSQDGPRLRHDGHLAASL